MRHIPSMLAISALLAVGAATASAQSTGYVGPRNASRAAPYSGPGNVSLTTVRKLLDTGRDDQRARLQGRIISYEGGDRYRFEDETGRITVEIDDEDFPTGQTVSAQQRVELIGEFDKGLRKVEFEVERIALFP